MAAMTAASFSLAVPNSTASPASQRAELPAGNVSARFAQVGGFSATSANGAALRATYIGLPLSGNAVNRRTSTAVYAVEEDIDVSEPAPPAQGTKLYVGNLPFNVDSESLAGIFGQAGEVDQVDVIYDRETGRSRGFAFVTMAYPEDAEAAIQRFDGTELGGRMLRVNYPVAKGERTARTERAPRTERPESGSAGASSGNKLYVGNLSWGMDDYGLADLFSEFGQVMEAKVVLDRETGKSRGFGFVTFGTSEEGGDAVNALDGVEVDGRTIRVSVAQERASTGGSRGGRY